MATETFKCPLSACGWTTTEDTVCSWCKGTGHTQPSGLRMAYRCSGCGGTGQRAPLALHLKWEHQPSHFVAEIETLRAQLERAEAQIRAWLVVAS